VPAERALDILAVEAKEGMIDPHLLRTFIEARVFTSVIINPSPARLLG
jgi:hypothetical protein